ncbi:MAG: glycoside hydrolase family 16 protein [Akkermansiaceae bacterium]|nr:glycoside hydrolase family 16 protein [Akkermansiaceae bacterium]
MRESPLAAATVLLAAGLLPAEVLLVDHFDGSGLDFAKWEVPTPYLGRTQMRAIAPEVANGVCRLALDTHNPTALVPGDSFWGSEIRTLAEYPRGEGLIVEARTRFVGPIAGGMIGSVFTYEYNEQPGAQHDEIDIELLSNDVAAGNERVLTNVFEEGFTDSGDAAFAVVAGLDLTQFNVWRIEWLPDRVRWLVNGTLVREDFSPVPDEAQRVHLNFWAPNQNFSIAYDPALQPVADPAQNSVYHYEIDYVRVERPGGATLPEVLANGGFEAADLAGWLTTGNSFRESGPQPRTGDGVLKLFQNFSGANNTSLAYQTLAAEPGAHYVFCGYGRNGNSDGNDLLQPGNSALLKIVWRHADGSEIGSVEQPAAEHLGPDTPPQAWQFMQVSGTAPPGTASAEVFVIHLYIVNPGPDNGSSWFDDLHFCRSSNRALRIVSLGVDDSAVRVTWNSHPCERYALERSSNGADWASVQSAIPGAAAPATITTTVVPLEGGSATFYRVRKDP